MEFKESNRFWKDFSSEFITELLIGIEMPVVAGEVNELISSKNLNPSEYSEPDEKFIIQIYNAINNIKSCCLIESENMDNFSIDFIIGLLSIFDGDKEYIDDIKPGSLSYESLNSLIESTYSEIVEDNTIESMISVMVDFYKELIVKGFFPKYSHIIFWLIFNGLLIKKNEGPIMIEDDREEFIDMIDKALEEYEPNGSIVNGTYTQHLVRMLIQKSEIWRFKNEDEYIKDFN